VQGLGINPEGLRHAVDAWRDNVNGFFNLLALEIWGRLFFFKESIEEVQSRLHQKSAPSGAAKRVLAA
jgi:hypothetical protein